MNLNEIVVRLHLAVQAAKGRGLMERDNAARVIWGNEYQRITRSRDGLRGALCGRAEAHVLRLSLIYALLDSSASIRPEHLQAALAVWDYCERSIEHIFGGATGDIEGDRIIAALAGGPMTMTDLRRLFNNHRDADWVLAKMGMLERAGKVFETRKKVDGKGLVQAWDLTVKDGPQSAP